jgi:hypothetical protein
MTVLFPLNGATNMVGNPLSSALTEPAKAASNSEVQTSEMGFVLMPVS